MAFSEDSLWFRPSSFGGAEVVAIPFPAPPMAASSLPVCDDFDSYDALTNLTEQNPIYSLLPGSFGGEDVRDFLVSLSGNLVQQYRDRYHTAVLQTTWENSGSFSLAIDFEVGQAQEGAQPDDLDFVVAFGDLITPQEEDRTYAGAFCVISQPPQESQCSLFERWEGEGNGTFALHPFAPFTNQSIQSTMMISADETGLLTMTVNDTSIQLMTNVTTSLPRELDVYFDAGFPDSVGAWLDNLAYTGCGGNTQAPTVSAAPTPSPSEGPTMTPTDTAEPTSAPTTTPPLDANICHGAAVYGDPHFYTFRRMWYSYHGGGTEFILIKNAFIEMHAHFEIVSDYFSGTTDVAFSIGGEVGEIALDGTFYKDGVVTSLPATIGGYDVTNPSSGRFEIVLGGCNTILIRGINDVRRRHINIVGHSSQFQGTLGLLGSWDEDGFVGRDGVSLMSDETAFGEEWVVDSSKGDPDLFLSRRRLSLDERRLGFEDIVYPSLTVDLNDPTLRPIADEACGYIEDEQLYENCVFDVIATNDATMAESEFYEDPVSEQVMEEFCESNCNSNCEDAGGSCMFRCNSNDFLCVEELCKFIDESKDDGVEDDNENTVEGCSCGFPLGTEVAHDAASCGGGGREGILSRLFFCF